MHTGLSILAPLFFALGFVSRIQQMSKAFLRPLVYHWVCFLVHLLGVDASQGNESSCLAWNRVESFVHLQSSFNTLYKTKEHRKTKHSNSDPKCVPLSLIPSIVPEVEDAGVLGLFEYLFQDHKPIAPVLESRCAAIIRLHPLSVEQ